jgi:hypothetical protein
MKIKVTSSIPHNKVKGEWSVQFAFSLDYTHVNIDVTRPRPRYFISDPIHQSVTFQIQMEHAIPLLFEKFQDDLTNLS